MSEERDATAMFAILDDEYARAILEATYRRRLSAKAISEECDMSISTVSRRVNRLRDLGLLVEQTHLDPDGHHYSEYEARLDRLTVELGDDGFAVRVGLHEDPADRFTRIWDTMRND